MLSKCGSYYLRSYFNYDPGQRNAVSKFTVASPRLKEQQNNVFFKFSPTETGGIIRRKYLHYMSEV